MVRYLDPPLKQFFLNFPDIHKLGNGDIVSMNSLTDTYQENRSFVSPVVNRNVETVINREAEPEEEEIDHVYHEPFEMNNAGVWPRPNIYRVSPTREFPSPMSPGVESVNNIHYDFPPTNFGDQNNEPGSSEYQDPDELACVSNVDSQLRSHGIHSSMNSVLQKCNFFTLPK